MAPRTRGSDLEAHEIGANGFHDFIGSGENGHYPGVPPRTCHEIFFAVPVTSLELETSIDYSFGLVDPPP